MIQVYDYTTSVMFSSGFFFLYVNHALAVLITVHGAWDEWSPWSLCSSTCGRGFRSRTRTCTPPQFGGDPCEGPEKQTKFCNIAVCPGTQHANTIYIYISVFTVKLKASPSRKHWFRVHTIGRVNKKNG